MPTLLLEGIATVNHEALDADIKASVGDVYSGHSGPGTQKGVPVLALHFTDAATAGQQVSARAIALAHNPAAKTAEQALGDTIRTSAGSAVGVAYDQLTAGQVRALLALWLRQAGALNSDGTVKALTEWARD